MKLKIAVNKNCKDKTNAQKVAKDWQNIFEDIDWLMGWAYIDEIGRAHV